MPKPGFEPQISSFPYWRLINSPTETNVTQYFIVFRKVHIVYILVSKIPVVHHISIEYRFSYIYRGRRVIWISGPLIWSKTLMELIFNPCGEFRWSPEGPVSQIHSPHLLFGAPGIFSDILWFVQMLKRECGAENNGKLPHLSIPNKTATLVPALQWKICLWTELQPWFLCLQLKTCPGA